VPRKTHKEYINEYTRVYFEYYTALTQGRQEVADEYYNELTRISSEYVIDGGKANTLVDAATFSVRAQLIDPIEDRLADLVVNKPVVGGVNKEALRVSGVGNRFGTQIMIDGDERRLYIGMGNNSMNAFAVEAGFNQVVDVEEAKRIKKLQGLFMEVNDDIAEITVALNAKGTLSPGANKFVGTKFDPGALMRKLVDKRKQWNQIVEELGATISSRYNTDIVLPSNDIEYTRNVGKTIRQNPLINLYMHQNILPYLQYRSGEELPIGKALDLVSNVEFFDGNIKDDGYWVIKKIEVDHGVGAILVKHKRSGRVIAYVPPVRKTHIDALKQIFKDPDMPIDMLFIDMRYSDVSSMLMADPSVTTRSYQYLTSRELSDAIVDAYQLTNERPISYQLMNVDNNMQAITIVKSLETRLVSSANQRADVHMSPVSHDKRPMIAVMDSKGFDISPSQQTLGEIHDEILEIAIKKTREARLGLSAADIEDKKVNLSDEYEVYGYATEDQDLRTEADQMLHSVLAEELDIPLGVEGAIHDPLYVQFGVSSEVFSVVTDSTKADASALAWVKLHTKEKHAEEIISAVKRFSMVDDGKVIDLSLMAIPISPTPGTTLSNGEVLINQARAVYRQNLRDAVLSQEVFDKIIKWDTSKFASNIDARAEFIRLMHDYTWVRPHFNLDIEWMKHEEDVIQQVSRALMFQTKQNSEDTVKIFKGTAAKYFGPIDDKIISVLGAVGVAGKKGEVNKLLKERERLIGVIATRIDKDKAKSFVVLSKAASNYGVSIDELNDLARNTHGFSIIAGLDGISANRVEATRQELLYFYNRAKAYEEFIGWLNNNHSNFRAVVGLRMSGAVTMDRVTEAAFSQEIASAYMADGLGRELDARFDQFVGLVNAKNSFDAPVAHYINMIRIQELLRRVEETNRLAPEYTTYMRELETAINRFGNINNLFIDPPIYSGYDADIGGRVSTILSEIEILNSPSVNLLHGPFEDLIDFSDFERGVRNVQNDLRRFTNIIRDNNELEVAINRYFKIKINNFVAELRGLSTPDRANDYNKKLNEATEFVLGVMGYTPTEKRRFVLLDIPSIDAVDITKFDRGADVIFAHTNKLVKAATKEWMEKVKHTKVIEDKAKTTSNKEVARILTEREALVITLENKTNDLLGIGRKIAAISSSLPKDKAEEFNAAVDYKTENEVAYAFLNMRHLDNSRTILRGEIADIRMKIAELDIKRFKTFNMANPDQGTDDVIGGFNAIRSGKINPEAANEVSNILAMADAKRDEKSKLVLVLQKMQDLHNERSRMVERGSREVINKEIFSIFAAETKLSNPYIYEKVVIPAINNVYFSDAEVDGHIRLMIEAIDLKLNELDAIIGKTEKAIKTLKGYSRNIDIPFKKFVRKDMSDNAFVISSPHVILELNGDQVVAAKQFAPGLYTGRIDRPGLPIDLMKEFGLSGESAFLFPTMIDGTRVYKLNIPVHATARQANALIIEAENQANHFGVDTLVVEFPARIYRNFVPNSDEFKALRKYYNMSMVDGKKVPEFVFPRAIDRSRTVIFGSGYHYDVSEDNEIRKFQTIISKSGIGDFLKEPKRLELMLEADHIKFYDRISQITDDIGTPVQKAIINGELENWRVAVLEAMAGKYINTVNSAKKKSVGSFFDEALNISRGIEPIEFPVVVFVDKNNAIRIKNLGVLHSGGAIDPYSYVLLNSGKGFLPNDAQFSVIISGTADRFRVTNATGTLPKEVSFNTILHTITDIVSTKTRVKYTIDVASVEREIQESYDEMDKAIKRLQIPQEVLDYITKGEKRLKETLARDILASPGIRSKENAAMKKYYANIRKLYAEVLTKHERFTDLHKYVSIKNKYLGEAGKRVYSDNLVDDGIITIAKKSLSDMGIAVWFDNSIPIQSIPASFLDLQIREVRAMINVDPQKSSELYEKLETLKAMRNGFVNSESRTLVFNPDTSVIYNEYLLRQLIDVDLRYANIIKDEVLQAQVMQQISLLRYSIKRDSEIANKVRLYREINKIIGELSDSKGNFALGKELLELRIETVLTPAKQARKNELETLLTYFTSLSTNKTDLVSDIENMMVIKAEPSSMADWFKLRKHVVQTVVENWVSDAKTSLSRILPRSIDFKNAINGSPVQYINLFDARDVKIRELADAAKKFSEANAEHARLIERTGINEYQAEFSRIKDNIEELVKKRASIFDKFDQVAVAETAYDVLERLNNGDPFFDSEVAKRMKYILRIKLEELSLERDKVRATDPLRYNIINTDIKNIDDALKEFDRLNNQNLLRRSVGLGVDLIDKEIEANRSRLVALNDILSRVEELGRIETLAGEIALHSETVSALSAELEAIKLKIEWIPHQISEDAQHIYLMKTQRIGQIKRMNETLISLKNEYDKASGGTAVRLGFEISKIEKGIQEIEKSLIDPDNVQSVKEAEDRLAKNILQYDDVRLANIGYIKEQIIEHRSALQTADKKEAIAINARLKMLEDMLKNKDFYKQIEQTLGALGHAEHERFWLLANKNKAYMDPSYTERIKDVNEVIQELRTQLVELTGQMSAKDPFYNVNMIKRDWDTLKKVSNNIINLVKPSPEEVVTISTNNLSEIFIKRYAQQQFAKKFNDAAEGVDLLLGGRTIDYGVVTEITSRLKIKTIDDLSFLSQKIEGRFIKETVGKGLSAEKIAVLKKQYILEDLIEFMHSQKIKVPSAGVYDKGLKKIVGVGELSNFIPGKISAPMGKIFSSMLEEWVTTYSKDFDVISVDRFKVLTLLSRGIDKDKLKANIGKLERRAHNLRVKTNEISIEMSNTYNSLLREYDATVYDNLKIGNLKRKLISLFRKRSATDTELADVESLITVGKQFYPSVINITDVASNVQFKDSVIDFLRLSLGKDMLINEAAKLEEVDRKFEVLNIAKASRRVYTIGDYLYNVENIKQSRSELGLLLDGVVDGLMRSANDYNPKAAKMIASDLERIFRSAGVNVNTTFKVAGWNLPKVRRTLNQALIFDISSPKVAAGIREALKKHNIEADEFIYDMVQSLQGMSGVSTDNYGRHIVGALRNNISNIVVEFFSNLAQGTAEMPFINLQRGLSTKEAEEYRNLLARDIVGTLDEDLVIRKKDLERWSRGYRPMPKWGGEFLPSGLKSQDTILKTYIKAYLLDDGRIVIAGNEVTYDQYYGIAEPRFRILNVLHDKPLTIAEKYLFENYNADRKRYSSLFISKNYDGRGVVASALEIILKEKFGIDIEKELVGRPDAIWQKYRDKLVKIKLAPLREFAEGEARWIADAGTIINHAEWVEYVNHSNDIFNTFFTLLNRSGVDTDILKKDDKWASVYSPKLAEFGTVQEEMGRLKLRIGQYEADIFARVNSVTPRGVQIGLNPKSITNFLMRGIIGKDARDIATRYKGEVFPTGELDVFRQLKSVYDYYLQKPAMEEMLKVNRDRESTVLSLLQRSKIDPISLGVVEGTEYTIDDIDTVFEDVLGMVNRMKDRLESVDVYYPDLDELVKLPQKQFIKNVPEVLASLVLNTVKNTIATTYERLPSVLDSALEKVATLERKLVGMPFISVEYNKEALKWSGNIKLINGNVVTFSGDDFVKIEQELGVLNTSFAVAIDEAERGLIRTDIEKLETIRGILSDIHKMKLQLAELGRVLNTDVKDIEFKVKLLGALEILQHEYVFVKGGKLKRIKEIQDRIYFLVGDRADESGGRIWELSHPVTGVISEGNYKLIKQFKAELQSLKFELNGGIDKKGRVVAGLANVVEGIEESGTVIEYTTSKEFVIHTRSALNQELRSIKSFIDDFVPKMLRIDDIRVFQRMPRPIQTVELAVGDDLINNVNIVISDLYEAITEKNKLLTMPQFTQEFVSHEIMANIKLFDSKIKSLEMQIVKAKAEGDKTKINSLLVDLNELTSRRKVIGNGLGKVIADGQILYSSDAQRIRDINVLRIALRDEQNPEKAKKIKDEISKLESIKRTPVEIEVIDETKALSELEVLQERIIKDGIYANPEDVVAYEELQMKLNQVADAGLHIKMNTKQIAASTQLDELFKMTQKVSNHEWMVLYKDRYLKLMDDFDSAGDIFLNAKFINSKHHNLGVMMRRNMDIEQILSMWYEDVRGMLAPELKKDIAVLVGELTATNRGHISAQLEELRKELALIPDSDRTMLLRGYYEKRIAILENILGMISRGGVTKYQAVLYEMGMRLTGGVTNRGDKIKGLVADRQELVDQIIRIQVDLDSQSVYHRRIAKLQHDIAEVGYSEDRGVYAQTVKPLQDEIDHITKFKLLDGEDIIRKQKLIEDLTVKRDDLSSGILMIETALKKALNINTNEYKYNIGRFKEIAMSLPLSIDEALFVEKITQKFPRDIMKFVDDVGVRIGESALFKPKLDELRSMVVISNGPAMDMMQAIVDQMGSLSTYSIPDGKDMASDLTARFRIKPDFFERGELFYPTEILPDFDTTTAQLIESQKRYASALKKLKPGTVEMSEYQIQRLREYLDSMVIPEISGDDRKIWVTVLAELKNRGYDPIRMLPSNAYQLKKNLLKGMVTDKTITRQTANVFWAADEKIKAYAEKQELGKLEGVVGDLASEIKIQMEVANIRAAMARQRATIILIQNLVHYRDSNKLKREIFKMSNTADFVTKYKDFITSINPVMTEINLPGKVQTISMNTGFMERLASTFANEIYLSRIAPGGDIIRDVKIPFGDAVLHTELTDERMRILRKIAADAAEQHVKVTGEMLKFTDDTIKNAYKILSMDGVVPLFKNFAIVDISKDKLGQYIPVFDGVIRVDLSMDDLQKIWWHDPFTGYTSEANTEGQILEEYIKAAFIRADNLAIKDTMQEIIKAELPEKIDQMFNILRSHIPYEGTLKFLDEALGIGIKHTATVAEIIKMANNRVDRVLNSSYSLALSLLNGISQTSIGLLFSHAAGAKTYYKKGVRFAKYIGGRKDIGGLLRALATSASFKGREELFNTAAMFMNEETRRTVTGVKNVMSAILAGTYFTTATETSNAVNQVISVTAPLKWDVEGPAFTALWDNIEKNVNNWEQTIFYKRSDGIINKLLGKVNKAGNDMDRKMLQGVMPQFAVGSAVNDVRNAYNQAVNDFEGLISDTGYTSFNQTAMSNYIDNADQIQYFEYQAINDSRTCKYCRSTHGVLYKPTEPRPQLPRHPNCRCIYRPWFKSISGVASDLEGVTVPRVPVGGEFAVTPDEFGGGLEKLVKPINKDGTISDEDWIMWFNRQPTDIRQMMVGDAHDIANSIGVFGVDSPASKKALIASASKKIVTKFSKDMGQYTLRSFIFNTFTHPKIYASLFEMYASPKTIPQQIANLGLRGLMFSPTGIARNSVIDGFNRALNGMIPIDPNEPGPLHAVLNRIIGNRTIGAIGTNASSIGDFISAKLAGLKKEEWRALKGIYTGDINDASITDAATRAIGIKDRNTSEVRGFLNSEASRAFDAWFNIGAEGISPLADMSIATRTKIFQDIATKISVPEEEPINALLRRIKANGNHISNNVYNMGGLMDGSDYAIRGFLNTNIVDNSVDAIVHKDVLDIYGKLMGKVKSNPIDLLKSDEFKNKMMQLSKDKRELLIDMIKKPDVQAMVKRFFYGVGERVVTELDIIRVSEISPNGVSIAGSLPIRDITKFTIGPDGRFYATSKERLIQIWKTVHPLVDQSKFVSIDMNVNAGGYMALNPAYIKWQETVGINLERIPGAKLDDVMERQKVLHNMPPKYLFDAEYIITTNEGDNIYRNKPIVEQALGKIHGISPWSTRNQIDDLATTGITKIGSAGKNTYGKKYTDAINKIEYTIGQVVDTMKNEVGMKDLVTGRVNEEKVEQVARTVRGHIKEMLPPYTEYKDIQGAIVQFLGKDVDSEIFLERIKLIINQKLGM